MKVLFLIGSGRRDGNTARAAALFQEKLERAMARRGLPLEAQTVSLGQISLGFCRGCRACFDLGEDRCPLKDGLLELRDSMRAADALVVLSPVYVEDVTGLTKNLIDRLAFNSHRPGFYGKCAYLLTTSGTYSSKHALRTMSVALTTWGIRTLGRTRLRLGALSSREEIEGKCGAALQKAAEKLAGALEYRLAEKPTLLSLVSFRVQQRFWRKETGDSLDFRYWKEIGWLDPRADYYMPHRAGSVKRTAARILAGVVSTFIN
jgi:multimeric flavodoxin WrbA